MDQTKTIKTKTRYILVVYKVKFLLLLGVSLFIVSSDAEDLLTLFFYGDNVRVSNTIRVIIRFW